MTSIEEITSRRMVIIDQLSNYEQTHEVTWFGPKFHDEQERQEWLCWFELNWEHSVLGMHTHRASLEKESGYAASEHEFEHLSNLVMQIPKTVYEFGWSWKIYDENIDEFGGHLRSNKNRYWEFDKLTNVHNVRDVVREISFRFRCILGILCEVQRHIQEYGRAEYSQLKQYLYEYFDTGLTYSSSTIKKLNHESELADELSDRHKHCVNSFLEKMIQGKLIYESSGNILVSSER